MAKVEMKCTTVEQYFFYSEEVLPPRCKNARYRKQLMRRIESIPKTSFAEAPIAFVVYESEREPRQIRAFRGRLFQKEADVVSSGYFLRDWSKRWSEWVPSQSAEELRSFHPEEPRSGMPQSDTYFGRYDKNSRLATTWLEAHADIGGELWVECPEPSYSVNATGMFFVVPNGGFNALERDLALEASKSRWPRWHEDCSWSESLCCADIERIEVLMPECVKRPRHAEIAEWEAVAQAERLLNSVACAYGDAGLEWPEGFECFASYCDRRLDEIVREVASRLSCNDPEGVARDMLLRVLNA